MSIQGEVVDQEIIEIILATSEAMRLDLLDQEVLPVLDELLRTYRSTRISQRDINLAKWVVPAFERAKQRIKRLEVLEKVGLGLGGPSSENDHPTMSGHGRHRYVSPWRGFPSRTDEPDVFHDDISPR